MEKNVYTIQIVEKALSALESFGEGGEEINLAALSSKLKMTKSMAYRMLTTFEQRGYVEKKNPRGSYRLGLMAYEIGHKFLAGMDLMGKVKPLFTEIAMQINEAVYLVVRDETSILMLDMVDTTHAVRIKSLVGKRFPLQHTTAGKVILAFSKASPALLGAADAEELRAIRAAGSARELGGFGEGIASVAVPLIEYDGMVSGSLCVVGPDFRLTPSQINKKILPILSAAGKVGPHRFSSRAGQEIKSFLCRSTTQ